MGYHSRIFVDVSPDRFFFCHLPKTAGMSTLAGVRKNFELDGIYPRPDELDANAGSDVDRLLSTFETGGDRIRLVAGHFPLCVADLLGGRFRTFTILRHPVERTLSHLRYQRLIDPRFKELTAEEAYADPVNLFGSIHNQMVKMLGMTADEMTTAGPLTFLVCDDEHLTRAKDAISSMDVVGVQEEFPRFLRELESAFGWDVGEPAWINTTTPESVDPEFAERIAYDNPLDMALYEHTLQAVGAG